MLEEINNNTTQKMEQAIAHVRLELSKVRTGRANPDILNSIQIEYYGSMTPLSQVSTVSVPEPRMLNIQPFEKILIPLIEKAIMDSKLGLSPSSNGNSIIIPVPALSEERRQDLIKYVHRIIEEGRIAIRNIRRDAIHNIKEHGKDEHISEDEIRREESNIQVLTDKEIFSLGAIQDNKEKELLEF